ncbi:Nucleoside-diphosphate-sugar epimerase [Amycolatopsis xylanica]|uniref:Nucleoside-diphosphate-sugar epimerase n=1 Tax=Amycolatopsis xylanica TaxID=589385 RepID=A0A1H3S978_9PSEU|nr:SDR family oxidoreductase [Amycolatopsis xylanica]SDZ34168.1 Nucleoside-diphosphate-sugar epimerase [Amycolatopsis xylanica]
MSKIVVTGGLGYLGSVLVKHLADRGNEVVVVDNGLVRRMPSDTERIRHVYGDVREPAEWEEALRGASGVVHLAAIVGDPACDLDHELAWDTNYLGTIRLAEACGRAGVRRLVFASTCGTYGVSRGETADVLSPLRPRSVYAETKVRAEHYLLSRRSDDFAPSILRFATVYGLSPRMRFDLAVNIMTAQAVLERKVTVHGGRQWRPFVHVRDAAAAATLALAAKPAREAEIHNCGSDAENYSLAEVGWTIQQEVGDVELDILEGIQDPRDYRVGFAKTERALGFRPNHRLIDGIREIKNAVRAGEYRDFTSTRYSDFLIVRQMLAAVTRLAS